MKTIRLSTDDTLKLYKANTKRFLFAWVASGLCVTLWSMFAVGALMSTFRQSGTVPTGLLAIQCVPFVMSLVLLLHIWNKTRNTYLIISAQGIEFHAGWQHVISTWENVQGIQVRVMPYLILYHSVMPEWLLLFARDPYAGRRIPLWPFGRSTIHHKVN